jgi:hypothetical protein
MSHVPFHLPKEQKNSRIFRAAGSGPLHFMIPPEATALAYLVIGAGGGGGNGFSGAALSARGGGGGGGPGLQTTGIIHALSLLPPMLFLTVGIGGGPSQAGGVSLISTNFDPAASASQFHIARSNGGGSGAGGTGAAGGVAGAIAAAPSAGQTPGLGRLLGPFIERVGVIGSAGGAQTGVAGANLAWGGAVSAITLGGTGGGGVGVSGTNFKGGDITGNSSYPTILGGPAGGGEGQPGTTIWAPFLTGPGAGGGSNDVATGGKGGDGGIGCGGGGGGAGLTGGFGGRGGDGLIVLTWW